MEYVQSRYQSGVVFVDLLWFKSYERLAYHSRICFYYMRFCDRLLEFISNNGCGTLKRWKLSRGGGVMRLKSDDLRVDQRVTSPFFSHMYYGVLYCFS